MFVFLSRHVMFPSLFVQLLACSLLAWWVPMFLCRMSLLEVRMSCRLVFSSMFQCYPWICRGAWWMLSIRPWFFFESRCLGFCLWCCISVPGRRSFQHSWSECCWVSFPIITFVFNLFIFRPCLSLVSANCSILNQMVSQISHQIMLSSAAVNSFVDMVSSCRTPLLMYLSMLQFQHQTNIKLFKPWHIESLFEH